MKRVVLFVLALTMSTGAFAQMSWNVKAGLNVSNHLGSSDANPIAGVKAGIGMEYRINDLFSIQPSLLIATKGTKYEYSSMLATTNVKVNQTYLELPVMAAFRFDIGGNNNVVIAAGPYFAFGIGGKTTVDGSLSSIIWNVDTGNTFGSNRMNTFDCGLGAGVTFEFGRFFAGVDTEIGLMRLYDSSVRSDNIKNVSFSVGVGYRFGR